MTDTVDLTSNPWSNGDRPAPGLVAVFSGDDAVVVPLRLSAEPVLVGRDHPGLEGDSRLSRQHARLSFVDGNLRIDDCGSRNGSEVDGRAVRGLGTFPLDDVRVVRLGGTLLVPTWRVEDFECSPTFRIDDQIAGPSTAASLSSIDAIASTSRTILIRGESGTGKELAARRFSERGTRGPFVAVNCATIPRELAESLLFGATKGAYSGAPGAEGYFVAADGGCLFLDEFGELSLDVQAKLLRVLETGEVVPLGGTRPRRVDVRCCMATHRDLRAMVGERGFREDLYFRVASPQVSLSPLRERREEIPWHVVDVLAACSSTKRPHVAFVDACMQRPWPGNVRELRRAVEEAAHHAEVSDAKHIEARHLPVEAGRPFTAHGVAPPTGGGVTDREALKRTLEQYDGNVASAARALGMHRTQLYRLMDRLGVRRPSRH